MELIRKVTLASVPKLLTRWINPKKILSDTSAVEFIERARFFIFGNETVKTTEKIGLDIFTCVFVGNKPFLDYVNKKLERVSVGSRDIIKLAVLINLIYKGKNVRFIPVYTSGEDISVGEALLLQLKVFDVDKDYKGKNLWLERKCKKNYALGFSPDERSSHFIETIDIAILKNYMKRVIAEKELVDKINFRRFNSGLRLNNRPVSLSEINEIFNKRKYVTYIDLSSIISRMNLFALYAVTYHGFTFDELFRVDYIFSSKSNEDEERLTNAASELLNFVYNGNGVELSDVLMKMLLKFIEIPLLDLKTLDLKVICKNYTYFYAAASIAYMYDKTLTNNNDFRSYMRRKLISKYWIIYQRTLRLSHIGKVIAFCHTLANIDIVQYRDVPAYSKKILSEYEKAEKAIKEMNEDVL